MCRSKSPGRKPVLIALASLLLFFAADLPAASAADSGCVTCHLDQAMLEKNLTAAKGQKSAMQSGAG